MSTDPFVAQLAELCRTEPTRAKWVFVPTHAVGLTLGDRLAREGHDWANLRFVTPLDLAIRMAAPFLLERGIDPSEETLGPALVMRLLLDLPEEGGYFRPMAAHTSMADALWRTIRELRVRRGCAPQRPRRAAVQPRRPRSRPSSSRCSRPTSAISRRNRVADMPAVFEEAVRHLDWCPIVAADLVMELPDTVWSPLVRRFLDALPGERVRRARWRCGRSASARATALAAPSSASTAYDDRRRPAALPAVAGHRRPAHGDGTLDIFHAGGRDAEIDEVFRRILASGAPLDQVEIACASDGLRARSCGRRPTRLDWPVTLSRGVPAAITRPGRLLLRFCDWMASDFAAAEPAPPAAVGRLRAAGLRRRRETGPLRRARRRGCC